jgi:hypothetical protein
MHAWKSVSVVLVNQSFLQAWREKLPNFIPVFPRLLQNFWCGIRHQLRPSFCGAAANSSFSLEPIISVVRLCAAIP